RLVPAGILPEVVLRSRLAPQRRALARGAEERPLHERERDLRTGAADPGEGLARIEVRAREVEDLLGARGTRTRGRAECVGVAPRRGVRARIDEAQNGL